MVSKVAAPRGKVERKEMEEEIRLEEVFAKNMVLFREDMELS